MRRIAFVLTWAALLIGAAAGIARWVHPGPGPLNTVLGFEPFHVACHTLLFAILAVGLAAAASQRSGQVGPRTRTVLAVVLFVLVAIGQEWAQVVAGERELGADAAYDIVVDILGGATGLVVWVVAARGRDRRVAFALSWLLHPAFVGPIGLFVLYWSALRSTQTALAWCAVGVASCVPVAWVWIVGVRRGRFSDVDLSVRRERPVFLVVGLAWSVVHLAVSWMLDAPPIVVRTAVCGVAGAAGIALVTSLGHKVSGHVAVAVGLAVALLVSSYQTPYLFALAAVLLSWARVRDRRHTPRQVLGGWALGAAVAALLFHT